MSGIAFSTANYLIAPDSLNQLLLQNIVRGAFIPDLDQDTFLDKIDQIAPQGFG